ncbi:hypothetical protein AWB63_08285 [Streptococcus salivarius]|nr:hypothetical protein AWB63_08285 [Streptococcus salivarius]
MIEAYKKFWKGYVDFEGRSTRSDYWFAYLANMLTVIALYHTSYTSRPFLLLRYQKTQACYQARVLTYAFWKAPCL